MMSWSTSVMRFSFAIISFAIISKLHKKSCNWLSVSVSLLRHNNDWKISWNESGLFLISSHIWSASNMDNWSASNMDNWLASNMDNSSHTLILTTLNFNFFNFFSCQYLSVFFFVLYLFLKKLKMDFIHTNN